MNNRGIVSSAGPLTGAGVACVRATDLVGPEVLLVQEQDPEGYWKIFSIDLYPIGHDDTLDTEGDRKYHKRDETFRQNYKHRAKVVTLTQHTRVPLPGPLPRQRKTPLRMPHSPLPSAFPHQSLRP